MGNKATVAWLDHYLQAAEASGKTSPQSVYMLRAAAAKLRELGTCGIEEELEKLPPDGTGTPTEERRRKAMNAALVIFKSLGALEIADL